MLALLKTFNKYKSDDRGNLALLSALLLPMVLFIVGGAIDYSRWSGQRERLKQVSDTLATRGAREFLLANATEGTIKEIIAAAISNDIMANAGLKDFKYETVVDMKEMSVSVSLVQTPTPGLILTNFVPYSDPITITSTAVAKGGANVCVVALEDAEDAAISTNMRATISAPSCSIISNSKSMYGMTASGASRVEANLTCIAGGYSGGAANFIPEPTTDCPEYPDPLAERQVPMITNPVFTNTILGERTTEIVTAASTDSIQEVALAARSAPKNNGARGQEGRSTKTQYTLEPGVYEGGISIASNASVEFSSGIYVIKDGPFIVDLGAEITGENVAFYLGGDDSTFFFAPDTKISLTAPREGPLAGILFFEDRNAPVGRMHRILSDDARTLLGTFYLSRGTLSVASLRPVADESAYTALVVKKLILSGSSSLVLNTNYSLTDIPVPAGVGPVGGATFLRE